MDKEDNADRQREKRIRKRKPKTKEGKKNQWVTQKNNRRAMSFQKKEFEATKGRLNSQKT